MLKENISGLDQGWWVLAVVVAAASQYFYGFQFKLSGCLTIKLSQVVFYAKEGDKMGGCRVVIN